MLDELIHIGFSKTEAGVYLSLIENTRLTASRISKLTGIKRTTVYSVLDELYSKGIIKKDTTGKFTYFSVTSIQDLKNITRREKKEILKKESDIESIIPKLETIPKNKNYSVPKIQLVEEDDIDQFMYNRAPIWNKNMLEIGETTWWGFRDDSLMTIESHLKWVDWYWKNTPKSIELKVFGELRDADPEIQNKIDSFKPDRREIKLVKNLPFTASQWVAGEYIINYITSKKPNYLIEIHDKLLSDNLRNLYKKLWAEN